MTYSQDNAELIEKARQASLADYFIQNGYETERIRNELHIKGYGGLYVKIDTNEWYCFSQTNKKGGRNNGRRDRREKPAPQVQKTRDTKLVDDFGGTGLYGKIEL